LSRRGGIAKSGLIIDQKLRCFVLKVTESVIIPVCRYSEKLVRCIESLAKSKSGSTEIIIVDDGTLGGLPGSIEKFPVKVVSMGENRGASCARNAGARASSGDILFFTDDDCVPMDGWVKLYSDSLLDANSKEKNVVSLCGRILSDKGFAQMAHSYSGYGYVQNGKRKYMEYINSANFAVFKDAYVKIGGFSEDMTVNEDPELALKLIEAGFKIIYEPSIYVYHNHGIDTLGKFLTKHRIWGEKANVKLVSKHKKRFGFQAWLARHPVIMLLMIIPAAFATTIKIVSYNIKYDKKILLYAAAIFLSKIYFRWGIYVGRRKNDA
jgi:GT2 family glycosyltransferase